MHPQHVNHFQPRRFSYLVGFSLEVTAAELGLELSVGVLLHCFLMHNPPTLNSVTKNKTIFDYVQSILIAGQES